jgi:thiol:disulfide interchange protein DsbG
VFLSLFQSFDGLFFKPSVQTLEMPRRQWTAVGLTLLIASSIGTPLIAGCSPKDDAPPAAASTELVRTPAEQYAALAKGAKGVSFGPNVSDYTVFVMFDPQCLHCARLWEESKGLTDTVKFVWVPVNFFDGNSKGQSALLLSSTRPQEDMDRVLSSVAARSVATPVQDAVPPYLEAIINSNTDLINRFHVLAVPYVVARNQTTSEYVARQGGMSREMLKRFLGIGSR